MRKGKFDIKVKFEKIPIFQGEDLSFDDMENTFKDIKRKFK